MDIKKILDKSLNFTLKRVAEILGLIILIASILLFISLISYSPEDPNFIFSEKTEIKNGDKTGDNNKHESNNPPESQQ